MSQLNREVLQTKAEMDKEVRKWSTFLQRPNRPIPIRKTVEQVQKEENGYRVHIVKQPKPKVDPKRTPTPPPVPDAFEKAIAELSENQETQDDVSRPETSLSNETDSKNNTDLENDSLHDEITTDNEGSNEEKSLNGNEVSDENQINENCTENNNNEINELEVNEEKVEECVQKTEEEIFLEKQLKEVQSQLLALSNLPQTIQAALNEVTLKLSNIVPQIAQVKEKKITPEVTPEREENSENNTLTNGLTTDESTEAEEVVEKESPTINSESNETVEIETNTMQTTNEETKTEKIEENAQQETQTQQDTINEKEKCKYEEWQYYKEEVSLILYIRLMLYFKTI